MKKIEILYDAPTCKDNMFWNYRVIKHLPDPKAKFPEIWYGVHEVFYTKKRGKPGVFKLDTWTVDSVGIVGETPEELRHAIELQHMAYSRTVVVVDHKNRIVGEEPAILPKEK